MFSPIYYQIYILLIFVFTFYALKVFPFFLHKNPLLLYLLFLISESLKKKVSIGLEYRNKRAMGFSLLLFCSNFSLLLYNTMSLRRVSCDWLSGWYIRSCIRHSIYKYMCVKCFPLASICINKVSAGAQSVTKLNVN